MGNQAGNSIFEPLHNLLCCSPALQFLNIFSGNNEPAVNDHGQRIPDLPRGEHSLCVRSIPLRPPPRSLGPNGGGSERPLNPPSPPPSLESRVRHSYPAPRAGARGMFPFWSMPPPPPRSSSHAHTCCAMLTHSLSCVPTILYDKPSPPPLSDILCKMKIRCKIILLWIGFRSSLAAASSNALWQPTLTGKGPPTETPTEVRQKLRRVRTQPRTRNSAMAGSLGV